MTIAHANEIYCLDADALINIYLHYPEDIKKLNRQAKNRKIVIVEGVCREIQRKSDKLKNMVETWQGKLGAVVRLNSPPLRLELARLEREYGPQIKLGQRLRRGFWSSKRGRQAADSQVVAVCKINKHICVSNDQSIQDACHLESIPCITWQEFHRRLLQGLTNQESFLDWTDV